LKEPQIKAALIDRLIDKGHLCEDAVVINELVVADNRRRADIVVAGEKLHAFEIKSDHDTLSRLDGQIEVFDAHFDEVTVVCGSRYADAILKQTDEHIGVWVVEEEAGNVHWSIRRRGKAMPIVDQRALASFMPMKDLVPILRKAGTTCRWNMGRYEVDETATQAPVAVLSAAVLAYFKNRHSKANAKFHEARGQGNTQCEQLRLLSLFEQPAPAVSEYKGFDLDYYQELASKHPDAIDISKLPGATSSTPMWVIPGPTR